MVCHAQEIAVPVNLQAALFSKVLPFNRTLHSRTKGKIVIGIVCQDRFKFSRSVRDEFFDAMSKLPPDEIAALQFQLVAIDIDKTRLEPSIVNDSIDVLYIAPLRAVDLGEIASISRTKQVLTLTGVPEYVQAGLSVGIGTKAGKPQILINLKAAKLEHADFNSQFLKIGKIVESEEEQ